MNLYKVYNESYCFIMLASNEDEAIINAKTFAYSFGKRSKISCDLIAESCVIDAKFEMVDAELKIVSYFYGSTFCDSCDFY